MDVGGVGKPLIYTTTKRLLGIKEENNFSLDCKSDPKYHPCMPDSIIREKDPYHAWIPILHTYNSLSSLRDIKSQDDFRHGCPPKTGMAGMMRARQRRCSES